MMVDCKVLLLSLLLVGLGSALPQGSGGEAAPKEAMTSMSRSGSGVGAVAPEEAAPADAPAAAETKQGEEEDEASDEVTTLVPDGSDLDGDNSTTPASSSSSSSTTAAPSSNSTTSSPSSSSSTTSSGSSNSTTDAPSSSSSSSSSSTTTTAIPSTVTPTEVPQPDPSGKSGGFSGWSFFGGIILTVVLFAIGFVGFKYYKARMGGGPGSGNYNRF